jgi:hypothetical protein
MMTDKSQQFISEKWKLTRKTVDTEYEITLTDNQWELLVRYLGKYEDTDEAYHELHELVSDLDSLEVFDKDYKEAWLKAHGNAYPIDKLGNNVEENN